MSTLKRKPLDAKALDTPSSYRCMFKASHGRKPLCKLFMGQYYVGLKTESQTFPSIHTPKELAQIEKCNHQQPCKNCCLIQVKWQICSVALWKAHIKPGTFLQGHHWWFQPCQQHRPLHSGWSLCNLPRSLCMHACTVYIRTDISPCFNDNGPWVACIYAYIYI